jgi:two-component system cell cycle sensor histidine kinase/response regulator CckA
MYSSDIFASAFENLRTGVLLLEKSAGLVMEANPAFLRMCGRPPSEVVGRNFWAPPLIDDAEAGAEVFAHLRAGGRVEEAELPLRTSDGSRLLLEVSGGQIASGAIQLEVRDATKRMAARVAERTEAQHLLAARMAGEFTDMHRALRAAGETLTNCARRGQTELPEADDIRKAADRAGGIVRDLQAYGGQLALEAEAVQLNELVEEMQPALQQLLGRDIQVLADLSPEAGEVIADPAQVRQILLKLAVNSGEAMRHGGKVRIATRNALADDPALGRAAVNGAYAILEVVDDGPGLDDASWERLYEPFSTTKPHGKRGLGLAAMHGIVRQMGGHVWAHSEPRHGACFRVYLPRTQREPVASPAGTDSRRSATILLLERNDGLRTVMTNILKKRAYRVLAARTATDALEMARTDGPADLLITEPEPELVSGLTALQPRLRTLLLGKPFELEMLLGKVRELLRA